MNRPLKILNLLSVSLFLAAGCMRASEPARPGAVVTAFIAASTKDAVEEFAREFKASTKIEVQLNADDSSKLATQIAQDASAQVFLSANEKWADFVKEKGFAQEIKPLLGNSLVLVVPKGNPATMAGPADLAGKELKRLALAGPTVPAGIYGRQALKNLKLLDALEADKKIVTGDNVRVALTYVERGEADAGVVYSTDAKISDNVEIVATFPADLHEPIRYPLVLLRAGANSASARALFDALQSAKAKETFKKFGFTILE